MQEYQRVASQIGLLAENQSPSEVCAVQTLTGSRQEVHACTV